MTDSELHALSQDIAEGKVFTMYHVCPDDQHLIPLIFQPISQMDGAARVAFVAEAPGLVYQYWNRRLDFGIKGYPVFASFERLTVDEWNRMVPMAQATIKTMDSQPMALPEGQKDYKSGLRYADA